MSKNKKEKVKNTSKTAVGKILPKLTEKYLQQCEDRAHSADPLHADYVCNDLRKRINKLTNHIRKLQRSTDTCCLCGSLLTCINCTKEFCTPPTKPIKI